MHLAVSPSVDVEADRGQNVGNRKDASTHEPCIEPSQDNQPEASSWFSLDQPLSTWSRTLPGVKPENMDDFVGRSSQERKTEAHAQGKIKRELNSFIIYRKAYKSVAEAYLLGQPDPIDKSNSCVSKVCALSWYQESPVVRNQCVSWAKKDREGHRKAFPSYKYAPLKRKLHDNDKPTSATMAGRSRRRAPARRRRRDGSASTLTSDTHQGCKPAAECDSRATSPPRPRSGSTPEKPDAPVEGPSCCWAAAVDLAWDRDETSADELLLQHLDWPGPSLYAPFFEYALFSQAEATEVSRD